MPKLSSYPERMLARVLGHDKDNLVGKGGIRQMLTADGTYYVRANLGTCTLSVASPTVASLPAHGLSLGGTVVFSLSLDRRAFTVTIASPAVFTASGHDYANGDKVQLQSTGAIPTGFSQNTTYFVVNSNTGAGTFQLSLTSGGAAINSSGTQSGTHYVERTSTFGTGVTAGTVYYVSAVVDANSFRFSASPTLTPEVNMTSAVVGKVTAATGNDTNIGSAATQTGAFLTVQAAADYIAANTDAAGRNIFIQLADSTYNGLAANTPVCTFLQPIPGLEYSIYVVGTNNAICVTNSSSAAFKHAVTGQLICLRGMTIRGDGNGIWTNATAAWFVIDGVNFGTVTGIHMQASYASVISAYGLFDSTGAYTISGSATAHGYCDGGVIDIEFMAISLTGAPAFSSAFLLGLSGSAAMWGNTYVGSATGVRVDFSGPMTCYVSTPGTFDLTTPTALPGSLPVRLRGGASYNAFAQGTPLGIAPLETLTSDRIYFVLKTGNDDDDGLTNNAGGAFLTIQRAVDVICSTLILNGNDVTIQVGPGTWTDNIVLKNYVGLTKTVDPSWLVPTGVKILGDRTTLSNVVLSGGQFNGSALFVPWLIDGFTLGGTGSGIASLQGPFSGPAKIYFGKVAFAVTGGRHASYQVSPTENYSITGSAQNHVFNGFAALMQYHMNYNPFTVTMTGTLTFSSGFAASDGGFLEAYGATFDTSGATFTGTSYRYSISDNCVIQTYGSGAGYFPGNTAGATDGSAAIYA